MIVIGALVAVSATLVWRRDGIDGVLKILTHDLWLFGEIMPRVLAGCLLGGFIAEILPHDKVSRSLGPNSGLKGLLIGTAFGAILPGGPFTAYPVAAALLTVGADFGATIAMVVSWTLIGYGRAVAWELPILGADFTLWRIVISLPMPVLAGALGRFVYVRMYPKGEPVREHLRADHRRHAVGLGRSSASWPGSAAASCWCRRCAKAAWISSTSCRASRSA